jgi:aspartate dehydrogenase
MPQLKLAIAGLGAIGHAIGHRIDAGEVEGISLVAVAVGDKNKAEAKLAAYRSRPRIVSLDSLADSADVVVECAPSARFAEVAYPAIDKGRIFMPLSVGQLLNHMQLVERARATGARIVVPTGALAGLDAIRALAEGGMADIRILTRKPPKSLERAPFVVENKISLEKLAQPLKLFDGSAREAIKGFPANVNVAVALSLAGVGPDATRIEIWADPAVTRNTHTISARSDISDLTITIENSPSLENPATGSITPLSAIAVLRRLTAPLVVGT